MSPLTNPKLAAIDDALTELEPILEEFGLVNGFTLGRSEEGSYNVPRRWLHRHLAVAVPFTGALIAAPNMGVFSPSCSCSTMLSSWSKVSNLVLSWLSALTPSFRHGQSRWARKQCRY